MYRAHRIEAGGWVGGINWTGHGCSLTTSFSDPTRAASQDPRPGHAMPCRRYHAMRALARLPGLLEHHSHAATAGRFWIEAGREASLGHGSEHAPSAGHSREMATSCVHLSPPPAMGGQGPWTENEPSLSQLRHVPPAVRAVPSLGNLQGGAEGKASTKYELCWPSSKHAASAHFIVVVDDPRTAGHDIVQDDEPSICLYTVALLLRYGAD
ncbi:hypothetical protein CCHR01_15274 [Colletotrichum chrysophilum]|uniref:Uncharacterized protein n=1 Tax=Colletotrichum chrysophilum TaxID=1836956 RepID=A0AAD9A6M9_9PEZI|nr:hypothetical protein CCHR01_15274 [Colletotrichum chrysophilum]